MEKTNVIPDQREIVDVASDYVNDLPSSDEIIENLVFWFNLFMIKGSTLINQRNAMSKPLECTEPEVSKNV